MRTISLFAGQPDGDYPVVKLNSAIMNSGDNLFDRTPSYSELKGESSKTVVDAALPWFDTNETVTNGCVARRYLPYEFSVGPFRRWFT